MAPRPGASAHVVLSPTIAMSHERKRGLIIQSYTLTSTSPAHARASRKTTVEQLFQVALTLCGSTGRYCDLSDTTRELLFFSYFKMLFRNLRKTRNFFVLFTFVKFNEQQTDQLKYLTMTKIGCLSCELTLP